MTILLIVFGFLGGVLGGMGMGGGTLLIPLLSFLDIPQRTVQAINLIGFLPMSIVALCFHFKNGLVETKDLLWLVLPAVAASVGGAILSGVSSEKVLRYCFGGLLFALGVWQLVKCLSAAVKEAKIKKIVEEQRKNIKADTNAVYNYIDRKNTENRQEKGQK